MSDVRLERLADILVNYSTNIQPGEWVGILGDPQALPALRAVYRKVVQAGGYPSLMLLDDYTDRVLMREGTDEQINWLDPSRTLYFEKADAYIRVRGESNTRARTSIPAMKQQQWQKAQQYWLDTRMSRAAQGQFKWVVALYPTEAYAQEAGMSLEEYEDFVYKATFADLEDPVAEWRRVAEMQERKIGWLKGKRHVRVQGPNADLELSIEGRTFLNASGNHNMPDGEIFTGPVEDSVNGWIRFTYPSIKDGKAVEGIELRFENGRVVEASARKNEDLLLAMLDTDPGARYLGEFAIGTNYGIDRFTGMILYDEKIGGTLHVAVGRSYAETGGKNQSAIHWDMICDMRQDSEITVDGELFYKNGQFVE